MKIKAVLFTIVTALLLLSLISCGNKNTDQDNTDSGTPETAECDHKPDKAVRENEVEPTCCFVGSYDEVVYCKKCDVELSREQKVLEKTDHATGESVNENAVAPTCKTEGKYDIVIYCTDCNEELLRTEVIVDPIDHTEAEVVVENVVDATCEEDGSYDNVIYCSECGDQLSRETIVTAHTGHTPDVVMEENFIAPTCVDDGGYDLVVYCSTCNAELSRIEKSIPAKDHTYGGSTCPDCGEVLEVVESLEYTLSADGTYYIVSGVGNCTDKNLVIPSEHNGLPVKEIGDNAFRDCTWIESATIPESIERLGCGAAFGCTSLKKLIFEDTSGWYLMDNPDATDGTAIPSIILKNSSLYIGELIKNTVMWMQKK